MMPLVHVVGHADRGGDRRRRRWSGRRCPASGTRGSCRRRKRDRAAEHEREQQHEHDRLQDREDRQLGDARDALEVAPADDQAVGDGRRQAPSPSGWRLESPSCRPPRRLVAAPSSAARSGSATCPVRLRNTSSSVGRRSADVVDRDAGLVEVAHDLDERVCAPPVGGTVSRRVWLVDLGRAVAGRHERRRASTISARSWTTTSMRSPPTWALSSSAVPWAMIRPCVDDRDVVGQLVGLLQVLRGQQQRRALADQLADDLPHAEPAARVEAGGRLVEEQQPRAARSERWPGRGGGACRPSRS